MSGPRPLAVALVGTTASGKSAVAMAVARDRPDVEILCVDSMTVYRGMDVGTAKPSAADRAEVPHHLLDLADPGEEFTVRRFQEAAREVLADLAARGRRALLVGGTGLYLRAVVDDLDIPGRYPAVAAALEAEAEEAGGVERLFARLAALDPLAAARTTDSNRRRIVRALEVTLGSGRPFSSFGPGLGAYAPSDVALVGIPFDAHEVDRRIEARVRAWVASGLLDEVRALAARPGGLSRTARQALGYKELLAHVAGGAPLEACVEEAVRRTRAFARRQWSWFRRDPRIRWVGPGDDPAAVLAAALDAAGAPDRGRGARLAPMVPGAERSTPPAPLALAKHEAAGNDFLVALDPEGARQLSPRQVRALCDRRLGVGADGLVVGRRGPEGCDLEMELVNADGSAAEMSGNGIRCLVQAAVDAGLVAAGQVRVATAAGPRVVDYRRTAPGEGEAAVAMGVVRLGPEVPSPLDGTLARGADVGNPHLVVVGDVDLDALDLAELGRAGEALTGAPVNVEVVRPVDGRLALRVFERGVGETAACGTGSCAAAAVARAAGLVGDTVAVDSAGGRLEVRLGAGEDGPVVLAGPVRHVADVVVDPRLLA